MYRILQVRDGYILQRKYLGFFWKKIPSMILPGGSPIFGDRTLEEAKKRLERYKRYQKFKDVPSKVVYVED